MFVAQVSVFIDFETNERDKAEEYGELLTTHFQEIIELGLATRAMLAEENPKIASASAEIVSLYKE